MKLKTIIFAGIAMGLLFGGWLVWRQMDQAAQAKLRAGFDLVTAVQMDLSDTIDATGVVVTESNASIYPPYSATVKRIQVKPGDRVHKGELLLVLQLKDADLINYGAGWKSALDQAEANLEIAQKNLDRENTLYKVQGTTIDQVESAQIKVRQYQAQVLEYRLKLDSLTKNGVDNQNNILIRAPFEAEVSWINVKLEESVTTATELMTLGGSSAIRVEAAVDQGDIDQIQAGQEATIQANDQNRTIIPGVVTSFGSTGTTSSNVITFPVMIKPVTANNPVRPKKQRKGGAGSKNTVTRAVGDLLKSGMSVDVTITVNPHPNVLAISLRALTEEDGQAYVKVFKNGQQLKRKVVVGFRTADFAEVRAGLRAGEQVAIPKSTAKIGDASKQKYRNRGGLMGPPRM